MRPKRKKLWGKNAYLATSKLFQQFQANSNLAHFAPAAIYRDSVDLEGLN
jgi:hypothetical protein